MLSLLFHVVRSLSFRTRKLFDGPVNRLVLASLHSHGVRVGARFKATSFLDCARHKGAAIEIGNDVTINNSRRENPAGVTHPTTLVAAKEGSRISIGDHVGISGAVLYCRSEIVIEDYVNIGAGCRIFDTDFHPLEWEARRNNDVSEIATRPIRICHDAFIGAGVFILKGVTIGPYSIIGAGSVVSGNIPANAIAAGVPARVVRMLSAPEPGAPDCSSRQASLQHD